MKKYICPVCKKTLTRKEYEEALGILKEKEKHFEHERAELQKKLKEAKKNEKKAKEEGMKAERARTQRLLAGKEKQIRILQERLKQLEKGSTPQTEGLEFEDKLASRLRQEFPEDEILHKGKAGDVLQIVKFEKKAAGIIIYECKRTPVIKSQHIHQAYLAKQSRAADFAVLVTTGKKKGFSGLTQISGVLIVSPLGTLPLASLLRTHLIEMLRAKISKERRAIIATELLKYITSPQFKNPIEEVVELTTELQEMIKEEARGHFRIWNKRWAHYQTIRWDSSQVQKNIQLVLHGKKPEPVLHPKVQPLRLPEVAG